MVRAVLGAVIVALVSGTTLSAMASPGDPPHRERQFRSDRPRSPERPAQPKPPRELLGAVRAWRLVEVLDLPEDEIPEMVAKLMSMEKAEREFRLHHRQSLERMANLLEETEADQAALRRELEELRGRMEGFRREMEKMRENLLEDLSVEQQARFFIFEERFPHAMRRVIDRLRGEEGRRSRHPGHPRGLRHELRRELRERLPFDPPPDAPSPPSPEEGG